MAKIKGEKKYLIAGLGNPGKKYQNSRHNVGFLFLDYLVSELKLENSLENFQQIWKNDNLFQSQLLKTTIFDYECILLKPQTYMNLSGYAVRKVSKSYSLSPSEIIVVHDDLDIPFGKFKVQFGTGPQLHKGIKSIEEHLSTKDFLRIRIGVDNRDKTSNKITGEEYVLQNFLPNEKEYLKEIFNRIHDQFKLLIRKAGQN